MPKSQHKNSDRCDGANAKVKGGIGDLTEYARRSGKRSKRSTTAERGLLRPGWRRAGGVRRPDARGRKRALRVTAFIERLRVPSGVGAGKKFILRPWQKDFIFDIYSGVGPDGVRVVTSAILSIARKNGKTALIAAIVLVHLIGPEAGINSEIVSAANDREQAGQVFKYTKQIIALSPYLTRKLKVVESKKRIVHHGRGNVFVALSAEAGTKHGLNPTVVIYDELSQSKNRELFDALETSQGAQDEPLFMVISTQSNDPQHPLSLMIDDALEGGDESIVCHLYEVPEEVEDIFEEEVWFSANPALGDFRKMKDIKKHAAKAKRLPSFENVFRNLYLNQRVSLMTTLFPRGVWMACAGEVKFEDGEAVYLALDMATTTDLCALSMISEDGSRLETFFWKPEDLLEEHGRRDRQSYIEWHRDGYLQKCPGKTIDPELVAMKIGEIHSKYRVLGLAYDRWRIEYLKKELVRADIDAGEGDSYSLQLVPWGQGVVSMSPAVDSFEASIIDGDVTHSNNPLLNWNVSNAIVVADPAGNRKLDKAKSRMRIDGAVSSTMVIGLQARMAEQGISVYEERGLRTI